MMNSMKFRFYLVICFTALFTYAGGCVLALSKHGLGSGVRFVIGSIGATLLALYAGYILAQPLARRLYNIEEAATLIAGGRLHHRISSVGEKDEVDHLAQEFNRMGERIEQQVTLLQQLAEENRLLLQSAERAATMEERQRVARDLHDSVSQELFSLTLLAAAGKNQLVSNSPKLGSTIEQIEHLASQAQREMRALLLHLRPIDLEGRSFSEASERFLQGVAERHGLQWVYRHEGQSALTMAVEEQLFRVLQEAVANVLKHAEANHITVLLSEQASLYELSISDDGCGFLPAESIHRDAYGLYAMHERVRLLGGRLEILQRNPGTTVKVVIPRTNSREVEG